jgi:type IX secretion system PorP/SprF family membrane protein
MAQRLLGAMVLHASGAMSHASRIKYRDMKKLLVLLILVSSGTILSAQQIPISENYFMDRYSLAPSYAGNYNSKYLVMGYRSDWSGIDGGPQTARLSYNDQFSFMKNAGYGAKIIYDKAGIFSQLYILGSYSYNLRVNEDHHVLFGLSMGVYKNRLNLVDYYNDPNYNVDPALISQDIDSRLKFMSDVSAVWKWKGAEAGFMFSNIAFGDASYDDVDVKYTPMANFQIHTTYLYSFADNWDLEPIILVRGGKYIKSQFEIATQVVYMKKFHGSVVYRDPGIVGAGVGLNIGKGLQIGYNFNLATNITMGAFNNHEISIGFNIFEYFSKTK